MKKLIWIVIFLSLLLLIISSPAQARGLHVAEKWHMFCNKRSTYVRELASSIKKCIFRKDTFYPVFHGCVDWHSSVHAHWALLRTYRITHDRSLLEIALDSMNKENMNREFAYMRDNPFFEMPYGRAWFLKLVKEYEIVTGKRDFRYFFDFIAKSLKNYLASRAFDPNVGEYGNQSWAYRNLLEYYLHTNNLQGIAFVKEKVNRATTIGSTVRLSADKTNCDFFSIWGNLAHLLSLSMKKKEFLKWFQNHFPRKEALAPIEETDGCSHRLGLNFSRGWSFWSVYKICRNEKFLSAYVDNTLKTLSLHEQYQQCYHSYGHWVPQFGIYAITSSLYQ